MVEFTNQMATYETACRRFTEKGIDYTEKSIDGYKVTFQLSKDGFTGQLIIDCESVNFEQQLEFGISAFEHMLTWNKAELERQQKKAAKKRG